MSVRHLQDQGLRAAREGRAIQKYVTEDTVTAAFVVQTAAAIYYDIPAGKQVVVVNQIVGCNDADEFAAIYLVGCDAITGGGTPTQVHLKYTSMSGARKKVTAISMMLLILQLF